MHTLVQILVHGRFSDRRWTVLLVVDAMTHRARWCSSSGKLSPLAVLTAKTVIMHHIFAIIETASQPGFPPHVIRILFNGTCVGTNVL